MSKRRKKRTIQASQQTAKLAYLRAPVTIEAAVKGENEEQGPPTFSAVAYSGGPVPGYTASPPLAYPYVLDLSGVTSARNVAANLDHEKHQRVGHSTDIENDGQQLLISGALSAKTNYRDEVVGSATGGFPWEVSIEGALSKPQLVPAGKSRVVNGRTLEGPLYVIPKTKLTGIAFCSNGADEGNSVTIAASAAGETEMNEFEKFMVSCGVDPEEASDEQKANLQAAYDAKLALTKNGRTTGNRTSFREIAEKERKENERQETIQKMALQAMKDHPMYIDQIERAGQDAIETGMDADRFELELLRSTRSQVGRFQVHSHRGSQNDPKLIEAALCLNAGLPDIDKHYSADVLNAVEDAGMRHFGLQQLLIQVAHMNGYSCRPGEGIHTGNLRAILEFCFPPATARLSGFSTVSLPGILGNVANKEILAGYMEEDTTWTDLSLVRPVNNFHAVTSFRLLDNLEYEEVGPAGEIKHGTLDQESYTRQAKTYAKMLGLTRQDIINDDLGAFDDIRMRLGMGAAKKFNNIFWAAFLDNAAFFTAARGNFIDGATSNLGDDGVGLQEGITAFRKLKSPAADGAKRVGNSMGRPSILVVPPELEFTADRLFTSEKLITGKDATLPDANIHRNKYRPVVQDRLSDSAFTGNSSTAWYLFGNALKPMVVSFLNGKRTPTVESTDADFDTLGVLFRGYHDFGSDKSEYLAGIKSKGAA